MRPREKPALVTLVCTALLAGACIERPPEAPEPAAPPSEPRATVQLRVDLERSRRCEEAFDLLLYQDRGIELVSWDEGRGCEGRSLSIRYLSRRTSSEKVMREVREAGAKLLPILPPTDGGPR
jgi:hypothetical protein